MAESTTFSTWEDYLYPPGTGSGEPVLRNLEGITDASRLASFEYAATAHRDQLLAAEPSLIERTFDLNHVQSIHAYLFQDVYAWAGQLRNVNIYKGGNGFAEPGGDIEAYAERASELIHATDWRSANHDETVTALSAVYANLNHAHPFREGNGRTAKTFLQHVADQGPFAIDYSRVSKEVWNQRSALSGPDLGHAAVHPELLHDVFHVITLPKVVAKSNATVLSPELSASTYRATAAAQTQNSSYGTGNPLPADLGESAQRMAQQKRDRQGPSYG